VTKKEAKKILKYADLTTEIQRICNVKTKATSVIIGVTRTISNLDIAPPSSSTYETL
jgi:hypothetical protein